MTMVEPPAPPQPAPVPERSVGSSAEPPPVLIVSLTGTADPLSAALQQAGFTLTALAVANVPALLAHGALPAEVILFHLESEEQLPTLHSLAAAAGPILLALLAPNAAPLATPALAAGAADYLIVAGDYLARLPFHIQRLRRTRELETAATALRAQCALLEEQARQRDAHLRQAIHDLRTPLTYLVGYSELLLLRDQPPETVKQMAGEIHREAEKLAVLLDHLREQPLSSATGA